MTTTAATENELESKASMPTWARIILFIISYFILTFVIQIIGMIALQIPLTDTEAMENISTNQHVFIKLLDFISVIIMVFIYRKFIDKQSFLSIGLPFKNRHKDILAGFAMAVSIIGVGSLVIYSLGYIDFSQNLIDLPNLTSNLILFILVALCEEIIFRGYILNNLLTSMNKYIALIISAVIFALVHGINPNLSLLGALNLFLAGILLGSAYIFTKNLWFPISLHLFWNFFQGPIFGYSVSGQETNSLFNNDIIGNEIINGGEFGFEGSVICTIITLAAALAILFYYNKTMQAKAQLT